MQHPRRFVWQSFTLAGLGCLAFWGFFRVWLPAMDLRDVVLQRDGNDCAPAAATMVLRTKGISAPYDEVRAHFKLSKEGASMRQILNVFTEYNIPATAWKYDIRSLGSTMYPAILFIDGSHFVVLDSVREGSAFLRDPAEGRVGLDLHDLRSRWDGEIILVGKSVNTP